MCGAHRLPRVHFAMSLSCPCIHRMPGLPTPLSQHSMLQHRAALRWSALVAAWQAPPSAWLALWSTPWLTLPPCPAVQELQLTSLCVGFLDTASRDGLNVNYLNDLRGPTRIDVEYLVVAPLLFCSHRHP